MANANGFRYKTYIGVSPGKGLGIFAGEFIPKNQLVWTLNESNHTSFSKEELIAYLSDKSVDTCKYTMNHVYIWEGRAILCTDNAEIVNHSSQPNLGDCSEDNRKGCWSITDINPNEELLDSYKTYETPAWYLELCAKYEVESSKDVAEKYF